MTAAGGTGCPPAAVLFGVMVYTTGYASSFSGRFRNLSRLRWDFPAVRRPLEEAQGRQVGPLVPHVPVEGQSRQASQAQGRRHAGHRAGRCQRLHQGVGDRRGEHTAFVRAPGAPHGVFRGHERFLCSPRQAVFRQRSWRRCPQQNSRVHRAARHQEHGDGRG